MADRYTSQVGLVLDDTVDVGETVAAAMAAGDIDRHAPLSGESSVAHEVHWGGRMQKAVVRIVHDDDVVLLRTETYVGADGVHHGMQRQARLLQAMARQLRGRVAHVWDESARQVRDEAWLNRVAVTGADRGDAIASATEGEGTWWVRTHGAARFDVPDLELYGLRRGQTEAATQLIASLHDQLLVAGLKTGLKLLTGEPAYLVPVLEAWQHLPMAWPGVGRAGRDRGPGLDGPRATVSILHRPRLGRYRRDFEGVIDTLGTD